MCGLPPGMAKAHHVRWWQRDAGPTDLANGVLLCETCHHRIHDNGWDIRIDPPGHGNTVWFVPPPHVDLARAPRRGGRARFDIAA
ncbi:HNH endonuclease [Microbacterium sp. OR16]|uniref:HNH endonuclease n=1 Tax=Microbacterium sp. OR16 TaxID=3095345 RepID=UPI0039B40607